MPRDKRESFCDIILNEQRQEVTAKHFSGAYTRARRKHQPKEADRKQLTDLIDAYWKYVDQGIRDGVVDGANGDAQQAMFDEIKAYGSQMSNLLFSKETQREIWAAAAASDIFVLSTNLGEVPWEALFSAEYGEGGSFLSDNCVIQRQLETEQELEVSLVPNAASGHIVCLDPVLAQEEQACTQELLGKLAGGTVVVHQTSTKYALTTAAKDASVIHWICEHQGEGLRVSEHVFYSHRDVDAHRFRPGSLLFLLSCGAGRCEPNLSSLSARIADASGCTVVAPSSVVAAKAAVRFMLNIDHLLRTTGIKYLSDAWFRLKNPPGGRHKKGGVEPRDCYMLWFGIYGDSNIEIGSAR